MKAKVIWQDLPSILQSLVAEPELKLRHLLHASRPSPMFDFPEAFPNTNL